MASTPKKWLMGCGIGCGAIILINLFLVTGGSLIMMKPFRKAIETREALDSHYDDQDNFTPAPDGAIPADRMEAFLRVRADLMSICGNFETSERNFASLDELDGVENPPKKEIFSKFWVVTKSVLSMGPMMGKYFQQRNEVLLTAGMGLGEYTYIYTLAYRDSLHCQTSRDEDIEVTLHVNSRIRGALREMARRQLAALETTLAMDTSSRFPSGGGSADESQLVSLQQEMERLDEDEYRLLWQDGFPPQIAMSLAPFRDRLHALFCGATVHLEFIRNEKFFIGIRGD